MLTAPSPWRAPPRPDRRPRSRTGSGSSPPSPSAPPRAPPRRRRPASRSAGRASRTLRSRASPTPQSCRCLGSSCPLPAPALHPSSSPFCVHPPAAQGARARRRSRPGRDDSASEARWGRLSSDGGCGRRWRRTSARMLPLLRRVSARPPPTACASQVQALHRRSPYQVPAIVTKPKASPDAVV